MLVNFVHDEWQAETDNNLGTALGVASILAESLRPVKFDNRFDIVSGADSKGDVVYIDRHIPRYSRRLKSKDGKPADLWKYLGTHETYEDAAMARGFSYDRAHEKVATPMERKAVEADGISWKAYSDEIDGFLDHTEHEKVTRPPPAHLHVDPKAAVGHHRGKHRG